MWFLKSFGHALSGILYALRTQRNMKVHFVAAILVVTVSLFLRLSSSEWVDVIFAIFFVLAAECANTAIEAVVDLSSPQKHPLAKTAKDCAAGAVLLAAINALMVAYFVLWPKILKVFL
ncbi:MAG: diacylglycerol kinase family protein [Firmicutes bacterium]|nr:diacylglycerol kinase family protein [Bacillota bacterium]MCL5779363.1 diacylglycerol kinase family protein [Bacillota bacterium]